MKPGSRALGIAESYEGSSSTLAGVVATARGRIEDFGFGRCTVGGTDATAAIADLVTTVAREDVRVVLLAGVALSWFNIVDVEGLADTLERPVVAVTFEASDGLEESIREAFDDETVVDDRLERYRALPPRFRHDLDGTVIFLRAGGCDRERARRAVDTFTPAGSDRPAVLRVAKLAARGADRARSREAL
ncbi:MAG: DUF99 family protein [Halobacteriota archaeon]